MNGTLAALPSPTGPFQLAPGGDPARQAVQSYLYYTQFYKGRTDGLPDDERMTAAIKLVQIAANLQPPGVPPSGVFDDRVAQAIDRFRTTTSYEETSPPPLPVGIPIQAVAPPRTSLVRDLATFAILTSPAWGLLLFIQRPWTKLRPGGARS